MYYPLPAGKKKPKKPAAQPQPQPQPYPSPTAVPPTGAASSSASASASPSAIAPPPAPSKPEATSARVAAIVRAKHASAVDFRVGAHTVRRNIRADRLGSTDLTTLAEHQREAQPDVAAVLARDADRKRLEEIERMTRELRELRARVQRLNELRTRSEPRDLPGAGDKHFVQTLRTPIPARPNMSAVDEQHRPVENRGYILPESVTAKRVVHTASGTYATEHDRIPTGQAIGGTKNMNSIAAPNRERAHGSHSHQRGASGPPDPTNIVPLSGLVNTESIGNYEKTINPVAASEMNASGGVTASAISAQAAGSGHLTVSTTYDPSRWLPATIAPAGLADLRKRAAAGSAPAAAAVATVERAAAENPATQERRFESRSGTLTHSLGLSDLQSDRFASAKNPRTTKSHLLKPKTQRAIKALHLAGEPRKEFAPVRSSGAQMQDALYYQALAHAVPHTRPELSVGPTGTPDAPASASTATPTPSASPATATPTAGGGAGSGAGSGSGSTQYSFQATRSLEGRTLPKYPSISTGMNAERSAAQLSAEGAAFIARDEQRKLKTTVRGKRKAGDSGDERAAPKVYAGAPSSPEPDTAPAAAAAAAPLRRKPRRVTFAKAPVPVPAPDDDDDPDAAADS